MGFKVGNGFHRLPPSNQGLALAFAGSLQAPVKSSQLVLRNGLNHLKNTLRGKGGFSDGQKSWPLTFHQPQLLKLRVGSPPVEKQLLVLLKKASLHVSCWAGPPLLLSGAGVLF